VSFVERLRALGWFLLAAAWFLFSDLIASRAAAGLSQIGWTEWAEPLYRVFVLFLLIVGYWVMSRLGQPRIPTARATAMDARPGWLREFALGAAVGWGGVIVTLLPTAVIGGLVVTFFTNGHQFWVLFLDCIAILAGTLAVEIGFRGYPFLRLVEAMGPVMATFFMAVIFAIWRTHTQETTTAAVLTSFFLGWVLALAVLRTRALWVSWGLHFAWLATMCLLFGLPASGTMSYSPVIATNMRGPAWVTGNGQGPEGSLFGVLVAFLLLFAVTKVTAELKHRYGYPEIVPGGIPVDLDAAARRQHEAAMGQAPAQPPLVQILPAAPYPAPQRERVETVEAAAEDERAPERSAVEPVDGRPEGLEPPDEPSSR
jgi:membrane protease YdiL (CAAX protease family)